MAEPIPAALKIPEISRFITRANQLRNVKPAIAYWCEYHAVNQIVGKNLHNTDDETFAFTKTLIERLEAAKTERADDDAIIDNDAGRAYVEQFAQETFARAERTMNANKVTRQTADTFDASATFFDLSQVWGPPEADALQKIKFAKWNAARILKAIREGRDPNESNPRAKEEEVAVDAPLDPSDPEVQLIQGGSGPLPAFVEEVADRGEPLNPASSNATQEDYFPSAPPHPQFPPQQQFGATQPSAPPGPPSLASPAPSVQTQIPPQPSPSIPTKLPADMTATSPGHQYPTGPGTPYMPVGAPPSSGPPPPLQSPGHYEQQPIAPSPGPYFQSPPSVQHGHAPPFPQSQQQTPSSFGPPSMSSYQNTPPPLTSPQNQPPSQFHSAGPPPPQSQYQVPLHQPPLPQSMPPPASRLPPVQNFSPGGGAGPSFHQKDINQAQKHAKYAISALNFEDVPTAINELRNALAMLGAR